MKVLVADDERIIRQAIIHVIDWQALGVTQVLEARNGREALREYERHRPEILITDIRMPLLDGLELVRAVRELDGQAQVIYITGFSDVSYLRSAVKNAAVDYILKPVDPEELLAALKKCVDRVREQSRSRAHLSEMERYARLSAPLLRRQLLGRVLYGAYPNRESLLESAAMVGLSLDLEAPYQAAVFSFRRAGEEPLPDMPGDILSAGIVNIAEELLGERPQGERAFPGGFCHLGDLDFACLLPGEEPEENLRLLEQVQRQAGRCLRLEAFGVAGPVAEGFSGIQESFALAYGGLQQQFRFSPGTVVSYEACGSREDQAGYAVGEERLERLCACVYGGDLGGAVRQWEEIWADGAAALSTAREIRSLCVLVCGHVFLNQGRRAVAPEENAMFAGFLARLESARYSRDFREQVESFFQELASMLSSRRVPRRRQIVEEVQEYIAGHMEDSLSIRDISAQVFLAPTYLCTLFKEETGSTINAYLTRQRMLYAARLLSTGEYKVYELARRLGYSDVKYFSSLFKRELGQTPSRYGEGLPEEGADERE